MEIFVAFVKDVGIHVEVDGVECLCVGRVDTPSENAVDGGSNDVAISKEVNGNAASWKREIMSQK